MTRFFAILCIAAALAGCARPSAPDLRTTLTRAAIDRAPQPLLLAEVEGRGLETTLIPAGSREGVVTWQTGQGQTLAFRNGLLVASRGLGDDLMSADVSGTLAALSGGRASGYSRLLTYLDGQDGTLFRAMVCQMSAPVPATVESFGLSFPVTLRTETCNTTGLEVVNRYWLNPDGTMRRAEQWLGPSLGMLSSEWLRR